MGIRARDCQWAWLLGFLFFVGSLMPIGCAITSDFGDEQSDSIPHPPADSTLVIALERPELDLSGYRGVQVEDLAVTYAEQGTRSGAGHLLSLNEDERANLGRVFRAAMERALSAGDGYVLATKPGLGVLIFTPRIEDLRLSPLPPGADTSADGSIWARSAGSMQLTGEFRDSVSGKLVGRLEDLRRPGTRGWLFTTDPVSGWGKPEFALDFWSQTLREELDRVRTNLSAER